MHADELTDEEIAVAFGDADYGPYSQRDILAGIVLKVASGYGIGKTSFGILRALGLTISTGELSSRGRLYLYATYNRKLTPIKGN